MTCTQDVRPAPASSFYKSGVRGRTSKDQALVLYWASLACQLANRLDFGGGQPSNLSLPVAVY